MSSCLLQSTEIESLAERGLSSFLLAVAESASEEETLRAGDCWIRAFETTNWSSNQSGERFVGQVTIKALGILAETGK